MLHKRPRILSYPETVRFHGHDGPFLALGYKLGRLIVDRLKPAGIMDLTLIVRTRLKKPYTCLIDGLQCSTLATTGKANLGVKDDRAGGISVTAIRNRKKMKIMVNREAVEICRSGKDLKKAARLVLKTPDRILFTVSKR